MRVLTCIRCGLDELVPCTEKVKDDEFLCAVCKSEVGDEDDND